jgi:hypothetical protein
MENLKRMLNQPTWNNIHSSVWKEIVSRFGQADYEDETKRAGHEATLKAEWDANAYARARQAEYPDMGSQLNKIYDDGIDAWKTDMVDPIKAKYPKP